MKKSLYTKAILAVTVISTPLISLNPAMANNGRGNGGNNNPTTTTTTTSTPTTTTTSTSTTSSTSGATCSLTDVMFAGLSATSCYNGTGNDIGNKQTLNNTKSLLSSNFGLSSDAWSLQGKSGEADELDFSAQGSTTGTWSFKELFGSSHLQGSSTFVVTLKSSTNYSAYLFENIDFSKITDLTGTFNTQGTSVNGQGNAQALSHASIFVANYTPYVASQPPAPQPPAPQPPAPQPPVEQPPVEQPPVEQPPAPQTPDQPSPPPPSGTVVTPQNPVKKVPEPATTAALAFTVLGALKMKKRKQTHTSEN